MPVLTRSQSKKLLDENKKEKKESNNEMNEKYKLVENIRVLLKANEDADCFHKTGTAIKVFEYIQMENALKAIDDARLNKTIFNKLNSFSNQNSTFVNFKQQLFRKVELPIFFRSKVEFKDKKTNTLVQPCSTEQEGDNMAYYFVKDLKNPEKYECLISFDFDA